MNKEQTFCICPECGKLSPNKSLYCIATNFCGAELLNDISHTVKLKNTFSMISNNGLSVIISDELLEDLISITNRSKAQTKFLLELLDGNFCDLIELECAIKYLYLYYCPGDKIETQIVISRFRVQTYIDETCSELLGNNKYKHTAWQFVPYFKLLTRNY